MEVGKVVRELTEEEVDLVLDALDAYKNNGAYEDLMSSIMSVTEMKMRSNSPEEFLQNFDRAKAQKDAEKILKEEEKRKFLKSIDLVRAKILLASTECHIQEINVLVKENGEGVVG